MFLSTFSLLCARKGGCELGSLSSWPTAKLVVRLIHTPVSVLALVAAPPTISDLTRILLRTQGIISQAEPKSRRRCPEKTTARLELLRLRRSYQPAHYHITGLTASFSYLDLVPRDG